MINNQKCDVCAFQTKCVAKNKLKPFTDEARVDLGVELDFISCNDFQDMDEEAAIPADATVLEPSEDY